MTVIPGTTFAPVTLEKQPGCDTLTSDVLHNADAQPGRGQARKMHSVHTKGRESMNFILWLISGTVR